MNTNWPSPCPCGWSPTRPDKNFMITCIGLVSHTCLTFHHQPCVKQVVFCHHRAKDTVANKQKAIFINNILIDMHSHSFLNSTQFKDILNFVYLFVYYAPRVRTIN